MDFAIIIATCICSIGAIAGIVIFIMAILYIVDKF
jgi:hypothetical protein